MAAIKTPHAAVEAAEHDISARDALRLVEILEDESGPNERLVAAAARFADWSLNAGQQRTPCVADDDDNA